MNGDDDFDVVSTEDLRGLDDGVYRVVRGNATVRVLHRAYLDKGNESAFVVLLQYPATLRRIDEDLDKENQ